MQDETAGVVRGRQYGTCLIHYLRELTIVDGNVYPSAFQSSMNSAKKTRNLAELHKQVVFRKAGGRIIWQPRIGCWYYDKVFAKEEFPPPFTGLSLDDIYRNLGCSARLYWPYNNCFKRIEHPSVKFDWKQVNETDSRLTIETPVGRQTAVYRKTPNSPRSITLKWEVTTEEEMKVATWRESNITWTWDQDLYDQSLKETGDLGAPTMYLPRMNVQALYIEKMGCENGIYAIYDWPETVEDFFRALEGSHDRLIDLVNKSPIDIINMGENVHAGTLSPDLFLKYHLPACRRRCEKLHSAGKFVHSHWDGNCKPLLKYAHETGLDGIEAITPEPQGDVTLEEIREALGGDMFLIDGIPAIYFDSTFSVETLIECAEKIIKLFAPNLVLGISDEISSTGDLERVRLVGKLVDEYNSRISAS